MKAVKLYITADEIKDKLGAEYKDSNVLFIKSEIGNDNTLTFECIITDEEINRENNREKLVHIKNPYFYENVLKMANVSGITFEECLEYLPKVIEEFQTK